MGAVPESTNPNGEGGRALGRLRGTSTPDRRLPRVHQGFVDVQDDASGEVEEQSARGAQWPDPWLSPESVIRSPAAGSTSWSPRAPAPRVRADLPGQGRAPTPADTAAPSTGTSATPSRSPGPATSYVLTTGTGSGKSLAYIVPIVDRVLRDGAGDGASRRSSSTR